MPMRGELPSRPRERALAADAGWTQFLAIAFNPDVQAIGAFCAIGFLTMVNVILRFPDFGGILAQMALVP